MEPFTRAEGSDAYCCIGREKEEKEGRSIKARERKNLRKIKPAKGKRGAII